MMLKLGRIAVVSTAALTLAASTIPTKAEACGSAGVECVQFSPTTNQTSERVTNLARCFATR